MHNPDQFEFQLGRSQLPYSEHLGPVLQEAAQQNTKKAHDTPIDEKMKESHLRCFGHI